MLLRKNVRQFVRQSGKGRRIAKRITDLVTKLKPLVESQASSKSTEPAAFVPEESDTRGNKAERVIANELKGY